MELYHRHTPYLLRFVSRLSGWNNASGLEDLVQETWLRGMKGLARFDWRSSFGTWLRGIAINVLREALRRERRFGLPQVTQAQVDRMDGGIPPPDHEGLIDLERALQTLPEGQRMVLVLHDLEGHTHERIGQMLEISAGTSKSQLHDARAQLERVLTEGRRNARR